MNLQKESLNIFLVPLLFVYSFTAITYAQKVGGNNITPHQNLFFSTIIIKISDSVDTPPPRAGGQTIVLSHWIPVDSVSSLGEDFGTISTIDDQKQFLLSLKSTKGTLNANFIKKLFQDNIVSELKKSHFWSDSSGGFSINITLKLIQGPFVNPMAAMFVSEKDKRKGFLILPELAILSTDGKKLRYANMDATISGYSNAAVKSSIRNICRRFVKLNIPKLLSSNGNFEFE